MTRTPLQAAETAYHAISETAEDGQFAAIQQVLRNRSNTRGRARNAVRPGTHSEAVPSTKRQAP